jgi:RNA polymerase sigma-70 factor (ECF subfamily)
MNPQMESPAVADLNDYVDGGDDDVLWSRVRQGNTDALAILFRRHADVIYNYCFRRLGDWGAAEDMVSIVFLEAWRRRDAEVRPGKVLPWLYGIATNVVRNRRRSERRYAAALRRVPPDLPVPDPADDVAARADTEHRMKQMLARVAELPRREQEVLALCVWSELGYEDAALALGVPVGTVRSRLSRARSHLRELEARAGHEHDRDRCTDERPEH